MLGKFRAAYEGYETLLKIIGKHRILTHQLLPLKDRLEIGVFLFCFVLKVISMFTKDGRRGTIEYISLVSLIVATAVKILVKFVPKNWKLGVEFITIIPVIFDTASGSKCQKHPCGSLLEMVATMWVVVTIILIKSISEEQTPGPSF